jgi:hypothetical protein
MNLEATLLTINTSLLALLLGVVGFFLRDTHRKFTELVDEVRLLRIDHTRLAARTDERLDASSAATTSTLARVERIESVLINHPAA